jgi:hypothetical protein
VPPEMEENSAAGAAARRRAGAYLATFGDEFASIGVQLGARYDGSPIVIADGTPPADDFTRYTPSGVPGGRAPHVWLGAGRGSGDSLLDHLGRGFTLLRLSPRADIAPFVAASRARAIPLAVIEVAIPGAREMYGRDLALLRPDGHIAWRGDTAQDAETVLATVTGAKVIAAQ